MDEKLVQQHVDELEAEIERLKQHKQDLNAAITLMRTLAKEQLDEAREAARWFYINHCEGSDYDFEQHEKRWPWLEEDQ